MQLGLVLGGPGGMKNLQSHPTNGAVTGPILVDFGVHGAGIDARPALDIVVCR